MKYYIAFSIHGTNTFITASCETPEDVKAMTGPMFEGLKMVIAQSRRPSYEPLKNGFKLHAEDLKRKDGKPLASPPMILRFFNELEKRGWVVDKKRFIEYHWKR